ncbi:clathrin assembly protein [Populus alba x Populus x berolinensis]|nr:clathrin assembly protein [Populus alba x Populus x berolinensis]
MHKRFRQVFCALKEHTSVSYAKIATFGGFCDVDLMIVKATAPDDLPLPEKYMHELVKIFSFSNSSFHSFSLSFTRRFGNTRSWKVALKCLILLHRLLRSLPEDSPVRTELLWIRSNGLLSLYPCHFRDDSSSNPEPYTVFIRSYAQLLDQALDCFSLDNKETEEAVMHESLQHKIKLVESLSFCHYFKA